MKLGLLKVHVAAALLSAAAFVPLAGAEQKPIGYPATRITVTKWNPLLSTSTVEYIVHGTPRAQVTKLLGPPLQTVTPDLVFYRNCEADQVHAKRCPILVVHFHQDRVEAMQFVNETGAAVIGRQRDIMAGAQFTSDEAR